MNVHIMSMDMDIKSSSFRPITEVKRRRAQLVLGLVTAWEHRVPLPFFNPRHQRTGAFF